MARKLLSLFLAIVLSLGIAASAVAADPVDIVYLYSTDNFDPNEDYTRTIIREELGINIIPEMGIETDKVNLILSSGQEYDAIKLNYDPNLLATYIASGAVQDLTDLVEKYPDLKNTFSQDIWNMVSSNGRIYAIPETDSSDVENGVLVREDWLNALGMSLPTTVDEFYAMLVAFKEQDPGKVGTDKVIPFSAAGQDSSGSTLLTLNGLTQAFGIGSTPHDFVAVDGKLVVGYDLPGEKEYLSFLNKLYQENLLDADFPATTTAALRDKIASGLVGCAALSCWDSAALRSLQANIPTANLVYLPPLSKEGSTPRAASRGGLKNYLIVPKASQKAESVVKYCNDFVTSANYSRLILGDLGVHYELKDGTYYPIFPAFDQMNKGRWFYPTNDGVKYTPYFACRAHKEKEMGYLWDDLNAKSAAYKYLETNRLAPMLPEYVQNGGTLVAMSRENLIKMVIDTAELAKYDTFVADWMIKGGRAWADAMAKWYSSK